MSRTFSRSGPCSEREARAWLRFVLHQLVIDRLLVDCPPEMRDEVLMAQIDHIDRAIEGAIASAMAAAGA
jgi:hypothetical protein